MKTTIGVVLAVLLAVSTANAGGLFLYEFGTPDTGLASAGVRRWRQCKAS